MRTTKYNPTNIQNLAEEVFYKTGQKVTKQQSLILKSNYRKQTGLLSGNLSSSPFSVMRTAVGAKLIMSYLIRVRFLDLKLTAKGRVKNRYYPIYNKPLYGFVFGYAYGAIGWGVAANIRENLGEGLRAALK